MAVRRYPVLSCLFALVLVLASCGTESEDPVATTAATVATSGTVQEQASGSGVETEPLLVVATTTILGEMISNLVGSDAELEVLLPVGADPHDYRASAAQVALLHDADLVVANGLGLEEGLIDVLETAEADGVNVLEVGDLLDPIEFGAGGHNDHDEDGHDEDEMGEHDDHDEDGHDEDEMDDHDEDGHDEDEMDDHDEDGHDEDEMDDHDEDGHDEDEMDDHDEDGHDDHDEDGHDEDEMGEHDEDEGHAHTGSDPHFWLDPLRVAKAVELIAEALADVDPSIDWAGRAEVYASELEELHAEIESILAVIPEGDRKLVTNHEALGYFADRYGFEVLDTVIPGGATLADPSSAELAALVETIREEGVPAIFAETIESTALADSLAAEAGPDVEVVELYTGSLGEPGSGADTLVGMLRVNAQLIAGALG